MTTAIYSHPDCQRHEMGSWHPECPERLQAIEDQLISSRIANFLDYRQAPEADLSDIARVHTDSLIALVRENCPAAQQAVAAGNPSARPDHVAEYYDIDGDTLLNAWSYKAALRAAGAAVAATNAVLAGEIDNAFCATRPPGHHARPSAPMGFCLFNNVAIAASHALQVHGLRRVAIVDFDVHHGNGTEEIFANDERVLMVSFFQHPFYPYTGATPMSQQVANSVNVPVPAGAGGEVVRQLVTERWMPALEAHRPQMIFISAGFDAHREDDMGGMALVEADYAWITRQIMDVANRHAQGRIVSCLEGGYALSALGRSVVAHIKMLAELE